MAHFVPPEMSSSSIIISVIFNFKTYDDNDVFHYYFTQQYTTFSLILLGKTLPKRINRSFPTKTFSWSPNMVFMSF